MKKISEICNQSWIRKRGDGYYLVQVKEIDLGYFSETLSSLVQYYELDINDVVLVQEIETDDEKEYYLIKYEVRKGVGVNPCYIKLG